MSKDETERIRAELRARPHDAAECVEQRVALMSEVARLSAERDEARAAARHLWRSIARGDGISEAEARAWWPWLLTDEASAPAQVRSPEDVIAAVLDDALDTECGDDGSEWSSIKPGTDERIVAALRAAGLL